MNSTLQCLSNTSLLTNFILDGRYRSDINVTNPLGTKGKLVESYGKLIQDIWSGEYKCIAPMDFKKTLGKFAPRFSGWDQNDSQELLAYLLDGIHEDLNRVKNKPYTKAVDDSNRPDLEVADENWKLHLLRNQSIIVDIFQGQLKSTVSCPKKHCEHVSTTFDPFMFLSVPIPSALDTVSISTINVIGIDGQAPAKYGIYARKGDTVEDILEKVSEKISIPASDLTLSEIYRHQISSTPALKTEVGSQIKRNSDYYIHVQNPKFYTSSSESEVEAQPMVLPAVNQYVRVNEASQRRYATSFGTPLTFGCRSKMKKQDILCMVWEKIRYWDPKFHDILHKNSDGSVDNCSYKVYIMNRRLDICEVCREHSCQGCEILLTDEFIQLHSMMVILILWDNDIVDQVKRRDGRIRVHKSANQNIQKKDTLIDCIKKFTEAEKLGKEDAWYCSKCKEHRQATKKIDIWRLPEVLVIHIKRFQIASHRREKLNTLVEFPLVGLDLSPFILDPREGVSTYDLFAVSVIFCLNSPPFLESNISCV